MPLAQKSILITGCSSGIGLAAAQQLSARGYDVIASCRKREDVARLRSIGLKKVLQLDLASSESIARAVDETLTFCSGNLYALFNNAAYGLPGAVEDLSRDALRRQFEVNVFGTHELTRRLIPTLLKQKHARIVQNSSVLGFVAMPNRGAYIASKFALEGLTDTLRIELAGTAIKCCLIEPGPITSAFRQNALRAFRHEIDVDASRHKLMYQQTLQRLQTPGPAMRFTLEPDAVVKVLLQALESANPKVRYRVTVPTHLLAYCKRFLSDKLLDRLIQKFGSG